MRARVFLGLGFALVLLAPLGLAGSEDDPEISDLAGDVRWSPVPLTPEVLPFPTPHDESFDILSSWVHDETPTTLSFTMRVSDLSTVEQFDGPQAFARWGTRFEIGDHAEDADYWAVTWIAGADYGNGPDGWHGWIQDPRTDEMVPQEFVVDPATSMITVIVDRSALGSPMAGDRLTRLMSLHDGRIGELDFSDNSDTRDATYTFALDSGDQAPEGSALEAADEVRPKGAPTAVWMAPAAVALGYLARRQSSK